MPRLRRFLFRLPLRAAAVLGAAVGSAQLRLVAVVYVLGEMLLAFPVEIKQAMDRNRDPWS